MARLSDSTVAEREAEKRQAKIITLAMAGLVIGLIGGWAVLKLIGEDYQLGQSTFYGAEVPSTEAISDFRLTADNGEAVSLSDFRGKVVLLYFGYTFCPDVCPTTLSELKTAMETLEPEERDQVQVMMVTVDPERDTPDEVLAQYLAHFNPTFLGLSGGQEEIAAAAQPFGIFYQKQEGTVATGYLVDHTATVMALDQDGFWRLIFHFNTPGEEIAADVHKLLKE